MSFRQSFSRFRKKAKDKLSNIGNSKKGRRTGVSDEGLDHSSLSLQPEPAIVTESELRGDADVGVESDDPRPEDSLSVSQSIVELGREPGGSGDYTDRRERGQSGSHPHTHVQAGRGPSRERRAADEKRANQVDPPQSESDAEKRTPTPSISRGGGSESA